MDRGNKYDRDTGVERNGYSTRHNNSHVFGSEPVTFTFPSSVPATNAQIENFIRSDVVAEKVDQVLENPKLMEGILNSPQFQQALAQFFSSAQGSEVLKKFLPQSSPIMPANHHHGGDSTHAPMAIDNHIQHSPTFSVLSWNILAPSFALPKFYGYCSQETLNINVRFRKITETLSKLKPDVICLQEMEPHLHNTLAEFLRDYKGTFANHEGKADGCSLFIKNSLGEVEFGSMKLSQNKSAATAYLKNYGFWIRSVHLTGDPKQVQTRLMEIQRALEVGQQGEPVLIAGDFNEEESGSAYRHLQSVGFTSACKQIYSQEPRRTFKTDKLDRAIDFIFYSPHFKAVEFNCLEIPFSACLPNEHVPSDHVYLSAQLAFTK